MKDNTSIPFSKLYPKNIVFPCTRTQYERFQISTDLMYEAQIAKYSMFLPDWHREMRTTTTRSTHARTHLPRTQDFPRARGDDRGETSARIKTHRYASIPLTNRALIVYCAASRSRTLQISVSRCRSLRASRRSFNLRFMEKYDRPEGTKRETPVSRAKVRLTSWYRAGFAIPFNLNACLRERLRPLAWTIFHLLWPMCASRATLMYR